MRLFNRTLYFFIMVIVLQAGLTITFVTNIVKRNNAIEAKRELENDVEVYKDNFNSWKRVLWKIVVDNQTDGEIIRIVNNTNQKDISTNFSKYIKLKYSDSSINCFAIRSKDNRINEIYQIRNNKLSLHELDSIKYSRERPYLYDNEDHPYIEIILIDDKIYIVGNLRIPSSIYGYIDFFVLKIIDDEFFNLLTLNKETTIAFIADKEYIVGNINENLFDKAVEYIDYQKHFDEFFDVTIDNTSYNIAIQKMDYIKNNDIMQNFILLIASSNILHKKRLITINRIVLYVSLISALLSVILSFFLTTNITRPIKRLLFAMHKMKEGKLNVKVKLRGKYEIYDLLEGFNDMANKLYEDQITMNKYIKEITELKDYSEKIINSLKAGIVIIKKDFIIDKANNFFLEWFKLKQKNILQKSLKDINIDIIDKNVLNIIDSIIRGKKNFYSGVKRYQNKKICEIKLYPLFSEDTNKNKKRSCVFIIEDISKKIEFEEKIFQAEKLSSISMLSAGIAHEINNPLSTILTNTQNLIVEENVDEKKVSLKWIEQETRRIARIVQNLLDFSSSRVNNEKGTNVNEVIPEIINLINYSLKKENKIAIKTRLEKNIPHIVISQDELKQIIINLIKNSIHAIEENGEIIVRAERAKNNNVNIHVIDNGTGIKEDVIPHIFNPFYTTKENNGGTGLGLSVVYGIINKYKGSIKVNSKEGKGTSFKITLPIFLDN